MSNSNIVLTPITKKELMTQHKAGNLALVQCTGQQQSPKYFTDNINDSIRINKLSKSEVIKHFCVPVTNLWLDKDDNCFKLTLQGIEFMLVFTESESYCKSYRNNTLYAVK